jgi:GTPase SAR1 family protein
MKIVVVGATGVGKTTLIDLLRRRRSPSPEFVEISWPRRLRHRFSKKRVCLGIIVVEPNRYSMLFLENMFLSFSPETPKIVILNKIDMFLSPFMDPHSREIKDLIEFCESHKCKLYRISSIR